ncbi:MAG: DNA polymerase IV [Patescibacteria group bacterium]|nr:DNA polymerase IV [Patescibacteria group bacterium]
MRIIGHLDMDAFFASVEERDNPRFTERPLVVGSDPKGGKGRGVVSTANYKAREYGIHSAMPISRAWQLSENAKADGNPAVVFCETDGKKYGEVSCRVMMIVKRFVDSVEQASVDEAYFDLSFTGSYENAQYIAQQIKLAVLQEERLTATVGIGPNRLVAKIATEMKKPNGLSVIMEEDAEHALESLPIRVIPGIGPKTESLFARKGIRLVRDAKNLSLEDICALCGVWGERLYMYMRGKDDAPVGEKENIKSLGEQETFEIDMHDCAFILMRLQLLARAVFERFSFSGFSGFKRIVLTVRFGDFTTVTRSHTLEYVASSVDILIFESIKMIAPFFDARENPMRKSLRLVGIRIEKLSL